MEKMRVLIVEDNPADVLIFKQMLDRLNYPHQTADVPSGEQALEYLEKNIQNLPHLILLDLELQGMHGLETLTRIKANPVYESIPVVVNTTSTKHEDISKTYRLGGTFFMQKLYDVKLLEEVITHLKITGRINPS